LNKYLLKRIFVVIHKYFVGKIYLR